MALTKRAVFLLLDLIFSEGGDDVKEWIVQKWPHGIGLFQ